MLNLTWHCLPTQKNSERPGLVKEKKSEKEEEENETDDKENKNIHHQRNQ